MSIIGTSLYCGVGYGIDEMIHRNFPRMAEEAHREYEGCCRYSGNALHC